jgi:hypothetical protein
VEVTVEEGDVEEVVLTVAGTSILMLAGESEERLDGPHVEGSPGNASMRQCLECRGV